MSDGNFLPLADEFYTLQGEGRNAGRAVWFIRLGGCDVGCGWCDTRTAWDAALFPRVGVGDIAARAAGVPSRTVVVTGGEPLIHPLDRLTGELAGKGLEVCLETSGTHPLSGRFDWICLSPKRHRPPLPSLLAAADELKVVVGSEADLDWAERNAAEVGGGCLLYLQPEWGVRGSAIPVIVDYIGRHPRWRLSLQLHKIIDIP